VAVVEAAQRAQENAEERAEELQCQLEAERAQLPQAQDAAAQALRGETERHAAQVQELRASHAAAREGLQLQLQDALTELDSLARRLRAAEAAAEDVTVAAQDAQRGARAEAAATQREAQDALAALHAQQEGLTAEFADYQQAKSLEVAALEGRVRAAITSGAVASPLRPARPDAAALKTRPLKRKAVSRAAGGQDADAGRAGSALTAPAYVPSALRAAVDSEGHSARVRVGGNLERSRGGGRGVHFSWACPRLCSQRVACVQGGGAASASAAQQHIAAAIASEAVLAAQRETDFERLARQRAQAELAAAQDAVKQLRVKLKTTQEGLRDAQAAATSAAAAAAQHALAAEVASVLRSEIADLQEALRGARSESARRLMQLRAMQV